MDVFSNCGIDVSRIHGLVHVSREEMNNYNAKKGDVFFTRTSETVDEIGIASALVEDVQNAVFSGFILRARERDENKSLFLEFKKYCFNSEVVRKQVRLTSSYTTRALTNGRLLSEVRFPRPKDIREQEEIAFVIGNMEAEISSLEKRLDKTKAVKRGMMQELLTGRTRFI
jgi:type I restriction enzyme S subunit